MYGTKYGAQRVNKLTAKRVQGKLKPGMHNDGGGLYLRVSKSGAKSWILRCRVHGEKRDIGLGGAVIVPLADARKKAAAMRAIARDGGDPLAERNRTKSTPTFEQAAQLVWRAQIVPTAKNEKHKAQWITTLRDYAFPVIGARGVDAIQSGDILHVLQPIWLEKPATAVRIRQRLRSVFDWAIAAQHRTAGNPVSGIETALPKQPKADSHHAAMPFEDVPGLFSQIGDAPAALCLRFLMLIVYELALCIGRRPRWGRLVRCNGDQRDGEWRNQYGADENNSSDCILHGRLRSGLFSSDTEKREHRITYPDWLCIGLCLRREY